MTSNLETWRPVAVFSCMIRNETTLNQHQQEGLAAVCYRKTILFLGGLGGRASKFDEVRISISNIKAARLFMLNPPGQKYEKTFSDHFLPFLPHINMINFSPLSEIYLLWYRPHFYWIHIQLQTHTM